ncbi:Nif3-like dinuclear metal center hexameric protein [Nonomuraea dietziae]|uniref:Nif3-like dinuclear metal center hexameric protein n=1 Tax=Nonomuraea dietziae TaxID=65515 RepID=UPI00336F2CD3
MLEAAYPPARAESWDAVGLVCGDPAQDVRKVLFAVDPVPVVAEEALRLGADLIVRPPPALTARHHERRRHHLQGAADPLTDPQTGGPLHRPTHQRRRPPTRASPTRLARRSG